MSADPVISLKKSGWMVIQSASGIETIGDTSCHCLHMELATGKYAAHPDIVLTDYITLIPVTEPLTLADRARVSKDYIDRICKVPPALETYTYIPTTWQ